MPVQTIDEQISQAQNILDHWRLYAPQIERVRRLEMQTMITPLAERPKGYYRLPALQGYQQIINAYQLLGNHTAEQSEKLSQVSNVLSNLQQDQQMLGDRPTSADIHRYTDKKMMELERTGETYMLSGHEKHFNITKITKRPDGTYTYTLYDAGHESKVIRWEGDRPVINAVEEHAIKKGVDIRQLIATDVAKKAADSESPAYKVAKDFIDRSLEKKAIRIEQDYGQRKGNCTTRGQRILAGDILQDQALSEGLYEFASNVQGTSTDDIKRALEQRVEYLRGIKAGAENDPSHAWRSMDIDSYIKAANPENYEHMAVPLDGGGHMNAYRTKPGLFGKDELDSLQGTLRRNGVDAAVRESISQPGNFYLYVPDANSQQVHEALARDNSRVAEMYRKYGENAREHIAVQDFVRAADPANYEIRNIPTADGGRLNAYRTKPGAFNKAELEGLKSTLERNGVQAAVQESTSTPGQYYLYVPKENADQLHAALARDDSPAAKMYRRYGVDAPGRVGNPETPVEIIGNKDLWQQSQTGDGTPISRIALADMPEHEVQALEGKLSERGIRTYRVESSTMGPTLRVAGADDIAKLAHWQHDLSVPLPERVFSGGAWQDAVAGNTPVTRIPTAGMTPEQVGTYMTQLRDAGLDPTLHQSASMGETIRLSGEDALKVRQMRTDMIAKAQWQFAATGEGAVVRVATNGMSPEGVSALNNALRSGGYTPSDHVSSTLGPTIRLKGEDAMNVMQLRRGQTEPAVHAPATATPAEAAPVAAAPPEAAPAPVEAPRPPLPEEKPGGFRSSFMPEGIVPEVASPHLMPSQRQMGMGGTGAGVLGMVMSAQGLNQAIQTGDKTEMAIAGTNMATATVQTVDATATAAGRSITALEGVSKKLPVVGAVVTVADGLYQISKEDTREHKAERAVAVTATATTAMTLGTAAATAGETAAVASVVGTGGAAVVVAAAPVVLTAAAVGAVAYTGEKAIESKRAWDDVDKMIADNGRAQKRQNYQSQDGKPSILGYKHIAVSILQVSGDMKNENMNGGPARDKNGKIRIDDIRHMDMRDPKNIAELERVLKEHIARDDKIIEANSSFLPKGLRIFSGDAVEKQTNAEMDRADLKGALDEIQMYKKELRDYDAAHPADPATTGAARTPPPGQKPPGKGPARA